jgi:hypothetical protein
LLAVIFNSFSCLLAASAAERLTVIKDIAAFFTIHFSHLSILWPQAAQNSAPGPNRPPHLGQYECAPLLLNIGGPIAVSGVLHTGHSLFFK